MSAAEENLADVNLPNARQVFTGVSHLLDAAKETNESAKVINRTVENTFESANDEIQSAQHNDNTVSVKTNHTALDQESSNDDGSDTGLVKVDYQVCHLEDDHAEVNHVALNQRSADGGHKIAEQLYLQTGDSDGDGWPVEAYRVALLHQASGSCHTKEEQVAQYQGCDVSPVKADKVSDALEVIATVKFFY